MARTSPSTSLAIVDGRCYLVPTVFGSMADEVLELAEGVFNSNASFKDLVVRTSEIGPSYPTEAEASTSIAIGSGCSRVEMRKAGDRLRARSAGLSKRSRRRRRIGEAKERSTRCAVAVRARRIVRKHGR